MDLPFYMKKDVVFNNYKLYVINLSIRMQSDLGKRETNIKQQITPRSKLYRDTYYCWRVAWKKGFLSFMSQEGPTSIFSSHFK